MSESSFNYSVTSILDQDRPLDLRISKSYYQSQIPNINQTILNHPNALFKKNIDELAVQQREYLHHNFSNLSNSSTLHNPADPRTYFHNLWKMIFNSYNNTNSSLPNLNPQNPNNNFINSFINSSHINSNLFDKTLKSIQTNSVYHNSSNHFMKRSSLSPAAKRRKRSKVTDSRLLYRNGPNSNCNFPGTQESEEFEVKPVIQSPLQMHHSLPSDKNNNLLRPASSSPSQVSSVGSENNINVTSNSNQLLQSPNFCHDPKKYTLTPVHLRKAKLMFLYTRYPNSQMLKSFFPDIIFYKQNTAQLVKWFSNFREFYYSEMEKAVQRYLSGGVKFSSELIVTEDCELFRNLMTHFNKNRQIEVPKEFMICVQVTLKEFYEAISIGKNLHQSWKKPIYKNIAKLDQVLPDFFRDMSWMLELAREDTNSCNNLPNH